jgi:nucleoside 2-deoxyribosyltransferase
VELAPPKLMDISFAEMDACDIVIVELSEKGVGLGIEAGYAYAQGIPIFTIARRGADVSTTLRGISNAVFQYETYEELGAWFQQLAAFSKQPGAITDRDRNPAPASGAT